MKNLTFNTTLVTKTFSCIIQDTHKLFHVECQSYDIDIDTYYFILDDYIICMLPKSLIDETSIVFE